MPKVTLELATTKTVEVELTAEEVELMKRRQALEPGDESYFDLTEKLYDSFQANHTPAEHSVIDFEYEPKDFE